MARVSGAKMEHRKGMISNSQKERAKVKKIMSR